MLVLVIPHFQMSSKLENALLLFISVRKWVSSVFTSGLTFNFLLKLKLKMRYASQSELYILKKLILTLKRYYEVSINYSKELTV